MSPLLSFSLSLSLRCWMKDSSNALLAHYMTNVGFLILLVSAGMVMLFVVLRKIRNREEWRKRKLAFLSMWGLSCLFGTTWALGLLEFGSLSCTFTFLFCIINTLQGKGNIKYSSIVKHANCWNIKKKDSLKANIHCVRVKQCSDKSQATLVTAAYQAVAFNNLFPHATVGTFRKS